MINIYDFDPVVIDFKKFDVSTCFQGKDKTQFAISFKYPDEIDYSLFKSGYERFVETDFYKPMMSSLSTYNLSPLRIIPPKIRSQKSGFVIYSGLINSPLSIGD